MRKAQTFIVGAVIFASLAIMLYTTSTQVFTTPQSDAPKRFFQRALKEPSKALNHALSRNRSMENLERTLYSFNKFVDTRAAQKGLDYSAVQLIVLPSEGKATVINYQESSTEIHLSVNGDWRNTTVKPEQSLNNSFSGESPEINLILPKSNFRKNFTAFSPRLLHRIEVSGSTVLWKNHRLY